MKATILTIRLKYFYLTYKGIKTVEVRKSCPKDFVGDVYECVSKTNWKKDLLEIPENERDFFKQFVGKVGLKFTLNKVGRIHNFIDGLEETELYDRHYTINDEDNLVKKSCLTNEELMAYGGEIVWHIDNLEIFDKPKELREFKHLVKYHCNNCPYSRCIGHYMCMVCEEYVPLTKAPQSWCYVEV